MTIQADTSTQYPRGHRGRLSDRGPRPRQDLPQGSTGPGRAQLRGSRGHRLRPARPQRGREVHHRQDPHHPGPGRFRHRDGGRAGRAGQGGPGPPRHRRGRPAQRRRPDGHRPGEPPADRPHPGPARARARGAGRRAARPVRPGRRGRPARPHLLRRHAAAAGRGAGPDQPAAGAVPRRADRGPGPGVAHGHVGRDRAARRRRRAHHPADHPLPGGGRPARQPPGHRGPRAHRRGGHARRAQGPAPRRRRAHRPRRSHRTRQAACRPGAGARRPRDPDGRQPRQRPRRRGRGRPAGRPRRARRRGRAGARRHGGAPVARRRLPASRGPPVRRRRPVPARTASTGGAR